MLISAFRRLKIEGRNQIRLVYDQTPDFFETILAIILQRYFFYPMESLILAQDERWRYASYMQVERDLIELALSMRVAHG